MIESSVSAPDASVDRLASLDGYRGFVMLLMMGEVLRLGRVSASLPESGFWKFLAHHQSHVEWVGCSLHDMIQPSFSFIVGVAMPFSLAARFSHGQSKFTMTVHAFRRALILVLLGIFLRSHGHTNWTFEDTLTQIGLGYGFLYLLAARSASVQWCALAVLLVGYWLAFALYPLPGPGFNWASAGTSADWPHNLAGFAAHWNKNTNFAWAFDRWFLNLFPRPEPFAYNGGGYSTLSFIPTLGTMILGLVAGGVLCSERTRAEKLRWFVVAGCVLLATGWLAGVLGICPVVKRIWTPSWTLFSGGLCFLLLASFYFVMDMRGWRAWAFPLTVVGMNSIAAYCMDHWFAGFIAESLKTHLGKDFFKLLGEPYEPLLLGGAILLCLWLILYWMWRRKLFIRI